MSGAITNPSPDRVAAQLLGLGNVCRCEPAVAAVRADEPRCSSRWEGRPPKDDARGHGRTGDGPAEIRTIAGDRDDHRFAGSARRDYGDRGTWCRRSGWLSASEAVEELFASQIEERIPAGGGDSAGLYAERFERQGIAATDLLQIGPLVIKFFRRRWCSYCVTELERGATCMVNCASAAAVVAIGPQTERQSDFMAGQHGLPFPVLV